MKISGSHKSSTAHHKGGFACYRAVVLASCFAAGLLILYVASGCGGGPSRAAGGSAAASGDRALPLPVFEALIHFATYSNVSAHMADGDIRAIAAVLRKRGPCNLLIFGLGAESPLWVALNAGGRTVILDENQFYVSYMEARHPGLVAYDVAYTTKLRDHRKLVDDARAAAAGECRPVQDLLYSECRLALNDLPNELYEVAWDVIFIDGPSDYMPTHPGRMASIFSAAVLARSGARAESGATDVLVHDFQFQVPRECSDFFLCEENRDAESGTPSLGHYVIRGGGRRDAFCANETGSPTLTGKMPVAAAAKKIRKTKATTTSGGDGDNNA